MIIMHAIRQAIFPLLLLVFSVSVFAGTYEEELKALSSDMGGALEKAGLKTIAIASCKNLDGKETDLGKLLAEELSVELVNQNKGVSVVDRSNLNRLMEEYKLTDEGLIDPENTKKLKLAGIDALIFGTITPFENTYRVQLKAVATDSAKVVAATRGSITESESLNTLMGVSRLQTKESGNSVQLPKDVPGTKQNAPAKQKINFGIIDVEIKSVIFQRKSGKIRLTFTVTNTSRNWTIFAYNLMDRNAPDVDLNRYNPDYSSGRIKPLYGIRGEATDDKGQAYELLWPSDAKSTPRLESDSPVAFTLEYKIKADAGSTVEIPGTFSFWFGFSNAGNSIHKCSVVDYPITKVQ